MKSEVSHTVIGNSAVHRTSWRFTGWVNLYINNVMWLSNFCKSNVILGHWTYLSMKSSGFGFLLLLWYLQMSVIKKRTNINLLHMPRMPVECIRLQTPKKLYNSSKVNITCKYFSTYYHIRDLNRQNDFCNLLYTSYTKYIIC